MSENDIIIDDLVCHFPVRGGVVRAVDHVSITLREGGVTGLIGESGCGKSVLGMAVLGLNPPYVLREGSIVYQGKELMTLTPARMRKMRGRAIGLIPQNPADSLNPVRRIGAQILEGLKIRYEKKPREKSALLAEMAALLQRFGFRENETERVLRSFPFELSGGMQQRVAAAMGIASSPDWIIADEPSKGLDVALREEMYSILETVRREHIKGMLIITHDLKLAQKLCNRLLVMYGGEILETGYDVLDNPRHPYTKGLLEALPANGMKVMEGVPPAPDAVFAGCKFAPRCRFATKRCREEKPELNENKDGGGVRCFLYD